MSTSTNFNLQKTCKANVTLQWSQNLLKYALINNKQVLEILNYGSGIYKQSCNNKNIIIINSYHGSNYYKGPGNIKFRCIIMILLNNGCEKCKKL